VQKLTDILEARTLGSVASDWVESVAVCLALKVVGSTTTYSVCAYI